MKIVSQSRLDQHKSTCAPPLLLVYANGCWRHFSLPLTLLWKSHVRSCGKGWTADKLLAWVFVDFGLQTFIFIKVTYELWGFRIRLSRLGFGIFRMHFIKHIFLSLNSKFHSNPLSLSGTLMPQSSAKLLSTKMS